MLGAFIIRKISITALLALAQAWTTTVIRLAKRLQLCFHRWICIDEFLDGQVSSPVFGKGSGFLPLGRLSKAQSQAVAKMAPVMSILGGQESR
jgi:hypothetical protein